MSDRSREQGVDLGDLHEKLETHDYPASKEDLLKAYRDHVLEFGDGRATFADLLEPTNQGTYDSEMEVKQTIMNMVGDEAIGRKNYSDRTPPAPGEDRQDEGAPDQEGMRHQESF